MARKKKEQNLGGLGEWIVTYGDMVTLMLCFFVALFNVEDAEPAQSVQLISPLNNLGMGSSTGGNTLSAGRFADLGNTIGSLPAQERGRVLGDAKKKAVSLFQPEVKSNKVRVTMDERGLVISLASDAFFRPASADVNLEETREVFIRLAEFLREPGMEGRSFRIEGHTDASPTDPAGAWRSNWELSAIRATNTLHFLTDYGVSERRFGVAGYADTKPVASDDTEEGRAYNRRVDIIVLDEGHL